MFKIILNLVKVLDFALFYNVIFLICFAMSQLLNRNFKFVLYDLYLTFKNFLESIKVRLF